MLRVGAVNWLAVIVSVVVDQVLGFLWYGPLFGNLWLAGMGKSREEVGSGTTGYIVAASSTSVMAIALAGS